MSDVNSTAALRRLFLDYFKQQSHSEVASSPLVPANDPTLLFTNAGMVQFKEVFLGQDKRAYSRATTCQRCVRAGGKHNDLDNVGYTARHHTFFEMLGNFSFGDYFKKDAIRFAWQFLTEEVKLPADKLWITVYEDDDEAADIWLKELNVDPSRFSRCGAKDNFWSMGNTGPCGPCTEIFYDHGEEIAGGPPGTPEEDGDRYIEIWNLVFMQYDRGEDGTLTPLPHPSVDTGMGIERLAAVLQGVHNNYDIDLFQAIIKAIAKLSGTQDLSHPSLRVIADHIRSCAFLVVDGVIPSNEGRGYVLRRIIRRALRHGHKLGLELPFFYQLVAPLSEQMGEAYPELADNVALVEKILKQEEERFSETLDQGMKLLEEAIANLKGAEIPGDLVFKLYDTYGFPNDLTADIARERELTLDQAGFETAMQAQRERARAASQFQATWDEENLDIACSTEFTGYDRLADNGAVCALFQDDQASETLAAGQQGRIILKQTPFYAESGGQKGDAGQLQLGDAVFEVSDTQKVGDAYVHFGTLERGSLNVGDEVAANVDAKQRQATARNHTATHLLHAALRQVLGKHVKQKGSLVAHNRLRFDFSHFEPITAEQLREIERLVNQEIMANAPVETKVMQIDEAMESGAMALFGEKYADDVRVLSIGEFSTELCGGTHVSHAGDIGLFKIISETGVAAGVRRVEAISGDDALDLVQDWQDKRQNLADLLKTDADQVSDKVAQLQAQLKQSQKQLADLQAQLASNQGDSLIDQAETIDGVKILAVELENTEAKQLPESMDKLRDKLGDCALVLATVNGGKVNLIAGVSKSVTKRIKAGDLVNHVAQQVGGKGGGRPDMARAGGKDPSGLATALASVPAWATEKLG